MMLATRGSPRPGGSGLPLVRPTGPRESTRSVKQGRWKIERLFAWLGSFRRLIVRYERRVDNLLGLVHLGCIVILPRHC